MKNYRIALLRHGLTEGNEQGRYIGSTDLPLSNEGREELMDLCALYDYPTAEKVYTSPLKRAMETAEILYPDHLIETVDGLREYDFGIFENRSIEELSTDSRYRAWMNGAMKEAPEGGETREQFANRVVGGLMQILSDMMEHGIFSTAVVGHAGVFSALLAQFAVPKRSPVSWEWKSGRGYLLFTSAQMWTRDQLLEVASTVPYGSEETNGTEYYWFDYPEESLSDT